MRLRFTFALLAAFAAGTVMADEPLKYPDTFRGPQVDDYHGTNVADPYRWLEDDVRTEKKVADWVEDENKVTNAYLAAIPQREPIRKRLTELWNYEKYSAPSKEGGKYFFTKNDGLQNQAVLYVQDSLTAAPKVVLDPNTWSKDGTIALAGLDISPDGKYMAFGKAEAGSDWAVWRVMELATGKILDDELRWIKFSSPSWSRDNTGFFYGRFPEPTKGQEYQKLAFNQKIYWHTVGTPQSEDKLIYERPDHPDWGFQATATEDGKYLVVSAWIGTDHRDRVVYKDLSDPKASFVDIIANFDNAYDYLGNDGPIFYFRTDLKAPMHRVVSIDLRDVPAGVKEVIPQDKRDNLTHVSLLGNQFIASYLKDAQTAVKVFKLDGSFVRNVELPGVGTASGFGGQRKETETFYSFSSFATPPSTYRYDLATGTSELLRRSNVKFDPADYEVHQLFYTSKDGTKVPMFVSHKKGIKLDGSNPTLLYGYGGFNISLTPAFSISKLQWMEMGGIYAQANIRGGGEYGKDWHQAAVKLNRPKAYEDFIAAAEFLIEKKYTSTPKLAIQGGSNGGLLVGACMTKRPDLYGACLPAVGVMDVLRFHKFTAGRYWVDDYGSADNADEFKVIYSYSPYHNLKKGVKYPATLVTTADTDDRVVPSHSFKFIAELQHDQGGPAPVLARIETRAGHGAGRPTSKIIEEVADQWAFLVKNLGMK
jgi:prolyl oligopeptidase